MYTIFTCLYFKLTAAILACHSLPHLTFPYMVNDVTALCMTTLSACCQRPYPRNTLCYIVPWQHLCQRKYSTLYSFTAPPEMAYIYLQSFPHRWRYCPFPFSLPLHSLTYITRQKTIMAASRTATRPGDARSATLFLGRGPPKHTYGGPFHTPRPKIHTAVAKPFPIPTYGLCRSPTLGKHWTDCPSPFGEAVEPLPSPT